jgi:hypothetical protein
MLDILLRILMFILGWLIVIVVVVTTIRTFIMPRAENAWLSRMVFIYTRMVFLFFARRMNNFYAKDKLMSYFAPVVLLLLPIVYLQGLALGFTCINWALGEGSLYQAFLLSESSLLTLGFTTAANPITVPFVFLDATLGLIMVAVLIAYLPTIYSAFSVREKKVTLLEVNAGTPPSAWEMIMRIHRNRGDFEYFRDVWRDWEVWFVEIEENHTSLSALSFLRSPSPDRSWVTAAGTILDCAALILSTVDTPRQIEAALCIRAGYLSLRRIGSFFRINYDVNPRPDDRISITREEFDEVYDLLKEAGVPLIQDRDQAWKDYAGWRVNYDRPLLALARLVGAPYAPWSSDRSLPDMQVIDSF